MNIDFPLISSAAALLALIVLVVEAVQAALDKSTFAVRPGEKPHQIARRFWGSISIASRIAIIVGALAIAGNFVEDRVEDSEERAEAEAATERDRVAKENEERRQKEHADTLARVGSLEDVIRQLPSNLAEFFASQGGVQPSGKSSPSLNVPRTNPIGVSAVPPTNSRILSVRLAAFSSQRPSATSVGAVKSALNLWGGVDSAAIGFRYLGELPEVFSSVGRLYSEMVRVHTEGVLIVLDEKGEFTKEFFRLLGVLGESSVGSASEVSFVFAPNRSPLQKDEPKNYVAVINMAMLPDTGHFTRAMAHAIGHVLTLGHSAANLGAALDDDPTNDHMIPMMSPVYLKNTRPELAPADISAVSAVFPNPRLGKEWARIEGTLQDTDAQSTFSIVAMNEREQLGWEYSVLVQPSPSPRFALWIRPGVYSVMIEPIRQGPGTLMSTAKRTLLANRMVVESGRTTTLNVSVPGPQ